VYVRERRAQSMKRGLGHGRRDSSQRKQKEAGSRYGE
jgi:hypothetical protein